MALINELSLETISTTDWPDQHVRAEDGSPVPYHEGQLRADASEARFTFVFAGFQGGKTCYGPWWLRDKILQFGAGDYIAATATFDLFKLKMLPEIRAVFEGILGWGRYWSGIKIIELADPLTGHFWAHKSDDPMWGRIILRSAQSKGGLESATAKAAWLDECGQDEFRVEDWEAIQRRLSISQGPALGTTTLYNRGWTKSQVYDRWKAGDPDYNVVQFPSFINPSFPKAEYDRIISVWPKWKVNMFARGEFDMPEGLIYGNFDTDRSLIDPFPIPEDWPRFAGHDFGGVNVAGLLYAENPDTEQLFLIDEYLEGHRTTKQHAGEWKKWKPKRAIGGAWSEDQDRLEFGSVGYPILKPAIKEVEIGIDRVYAVHEDDGILVFRTCVKYIDEKGSYSRETDRDGNPTDKIRDKEKYHLMDSERYVIGTIRAVHGKVKIRRIG